jgi:HAE1 family hydrophobic/amphiphilic exporter-1
MSQPKKMPDLDGVFLSDLSIKQPVFITMLMLLTIVVGLLSFSTLPVNLFPEINPPVVAVQVAYPGAGPESVADQVAQPLEDELSTLNGVSRITSNSSEGFVSLIIEFDQEIDPIVALQDVRERTNLVRPRLPNEIEEPTFQRFDPAQAPILTLAITSDTMDAQALRRLIDDEITPRIESVPGVGSVTLTGGLERQINVWMDMGRITSYGILPAQISNAIDNASTNLGLGDMPLMDRQVNLRTPSAIQEPQDIAEVGIPGTEYVIGDVATVEDGVAEVDSYSRLNGAEAVSLDIRKQSGTNTVAVAEEALAEINEAFAEYEGLEYLLVRDEGESVRENVDGAIEEILFAVLFAMIVVFIFFRDLRNTLVTVAGLPVVIIGTFGALTLLGMTLNVLTLLALSVSVGLVIDDAIVVRENIFRHMERGENPIVASSRGTAEVALSVLAMTLTIIAVFLPVAFTSGTAGIIFESFGLTVASAMAISLIEAFTLAPMLSAYFFKQKQGAAPSPHHQGSDANDNLPDEAHETKGPLENLYQAVLTWALRRRLATVGIAVLIMIASVLAAQNLKTAFFPTRELYRFGVGFEMSPGTPLDETDRLAREAEEKLMNDPAIEAVLTTVGGTGSPEKAEFFVKLHHGESTEETQERLRPLFPESTYPEIAFSMPTMMGVSTSVTERPLQARVLSNAPLEELAPIVAEMEAAVSDIEGLDDVDTTYTPGKPEIQFIIKPQYANDFGISNNDLARTLRALVDGDKAATFRDQGEDYDIVVRLKPEDRQGAQDLRSLSLPIGGQNVMISSLAAVELSSSPTTIRRADQQTEVIIGGNNVGRNITEVQQEMQATLASVETPPNVQVVFGGSTEDMAESFRTILIAMGLSVIFVYMVLASQFASFLQPFVIMLAMPLSFLGAFMALSLTGITLDIISMIGMVLLLGLVTKNSILLVDFTNRLFAAGLEKHAAITHASVVRLRPILMTSIAILCGNLPAAIGFGEGAEIRRGLAVVVIGGLITSTLLTLLIVPVAYSLLQSALARVEQLRAWLAQRKAPPEQPPAGDESVSDPVLASQSAQE